MEQLSTLEEKVKGLLENFEKLRLECRELKSTVKGLEEANNRLEDSLLQEATRVSELSSDREATKSAICSLVDSLDALGATESEILR